MPHIDITMYPGRSEELKAELAKNVRDCAAETLKMDKKYFSVSIEEVERTSGRSTSRSTRETFTKSPIIDSGKATFEVAFV